MTDLERRALLGDAEAQRECTEKGIVLACPWCGCDERDMIGLSVYHEQYFYSCEACGCNGPIVFDNDTCDYPEHEALVKWNTRPAPPIGRCGECEHWYKGHCSTGPYATEETDADFYCSNFKQDTKQGLSKQRDKESEENAAD